MRQEQCGIAKVALEKWMRKTKNGPIYRIGPFYSSASVSRD
jgi:hypothetical protein